MRATLPYDRPIVASVEIGRRRPVRGLPALVYPALALSLSLVGMLAPQRDGLLAVAQIFAPFFFLPLLLLIPFAFVRGMLLLRVALLLCAVVLGARFLPQMRLSMPQARPDSPQVSVLTWNVYAGNTHYDDIRRMLAAKPADIVILQESDWQWVYEDEALKSVYPYQLARPSEAPPGMILLSAYPILEHGILEGPRDLWDIPRLLWARLDLGDGHTVTVIDAHPISPYSFGHGCHLPICFDSAWRDQQITAMRDGYITPQLNANQPFILAGDFNVTDREPAYNDLSGGLRDAFRSAGSGFGTTWRPAFLMEQRLALLRIDYLFSSPNITPLSLTVDCTPRSSDHCIVVGNFAPDR